MTQPFSAEDHFINPAQLSSAFRALEKRAFIPGGDPSMGGDPAAGGGGGAPPMDPMAGGGAPPPGGGGGGGDGGGGGGALMQMVQNLQSQMQQMQMGGGGAMGGGMAGGAGGKNPLTPKIDEKAVMLQILKILARVVDHLKIPIPASEMVVNTNDMTQLAQASAGGGPLPGMDPTAQAGGAPGPMPGAGPPGGVPMPGAGPEKMGRDVNEKQGFAFDSSGLVGVSNRAAAIARTRRAQLARAA